MKRREFMRLIGGVACARPFEVAAQTAANSSREAGITSFQIKSRSNGAFEPAGAGMFPIAGGQPFLMVADSAQAMATNIAGSDIDLYLSTRASQGFNTIQFDLVATPYVGNNNANYATVGGIRPFTGALVTTPNPTYFALMDSYVQKCLDLGMVAFINPYETGNGLNDLNNAGTSAVFAFGQYIGNRYKSFPNVMYHLGNDCDIRSSGSYDMMVNLANGILSADLNHLMTIELFFVGSGLSVQKTTAFTNMGGFGRFNFLSLQGCYTYNAAYECALQAYNDTSTSFIGDAGTNNNPKAPSILLEANYEKSTLWGGGAPDNLRRQAYCCLTCGQSGQIYGHWSIFQFLSDWKTALSSVGKADLIRWKNFCNSLPWQNLIPDQAHAVGISGFGTPKLSEFPQDSNYCTVAATADGRYCVAYFPGGGGVTSLVVDMTKFAGPVTARWFDPTSASFATISGSPFGNTGTHSFTPSGNNSAGDSDWVLLLTA
jgi:hypothetical protein